MSYFATVASGLTAKSDLSYVNSELAGKEPLVALAVDRVVSTTSSGQLEASNVSTTELASLSGVSSSVQSQLDTKEPLVALTVNRVVTVNNSGQLEYD